MDRLATSIFAALVGVHQPKHEECSLYDVNVLFFKIKRISTAVNKEIKAIPILILFFI
jgi:hypothetical protein